MIRKTWFVLLLATWGLGQTTMAQNADDYRGGWRTDRGEAHIYQFSIRADKVRGIYCTYCADATTLAFVDGTFDAFGKEGAGALAAWMILTGNRDALNPILDSIRALVSQLRVGHEEHHVPESTLWLVLAALGDSLLGEPITSSLGLQRDAARRIATEALRSEIAARHPRMA